MPFGLDIKSMIVGALIVWFVVPWVLQMVGGSKNKGASASTPAM